ncbi:MAG: VUT family protein, partial [Acidimicrobiia bacterium]|nr:VUT family protein [Acidimicrobiia bacterium]
VDRFGSRHQWGRVLASNAVAIPIDSVIFAVIAFAGVLSGDAVVEIIVTNIVVKAIVTIVSIPWIYAVRPGRVVDDD